MMERCVRRCGQPPERDPAMPEMKRREAREEVLGLLFETEFHAAKTPDEILELAMLDRDLLDPEYLRDVYFGVLREKAWIDERISRHSKGWSVGRIAPVSRNILRLAIYEMRFRDDVPERVAINEAIELAKKFDAERAPAFVNGVLNSVKDELAQTGE